MRRSGILFLMIMIMSSVHGQDTLSLVNDTVPVLTKASVIIDTQEYLPQEYTARNLYGSWQKAYPFKHLSDSAYMAAKADTLLDKTKRPFSYSPVKLSADSIMAQVRCIPFDDELYVGQSDFRLPLINTGSIPEDKTPSLVENLKKSSEKKNWSYVEPANQYFEQNNLVRNQRAVAAYRYAQHDPSRFAYMRGKMVLPPTMDREKVSTEKSLEGKTLAPVNSAKVTGQISGIKNSIKADVWHRKGSSDLQLSQTALTGNWYKGGDNNMTVSTVQKLEWSTYDENKKTSFDVLLEMRLSALYTKADTVNELRVNDNQFSATVKYGYQAWKKWYYSTTLYAKTPIFDYHNANSRVTKSTFLAPLEANLSLGLEYKYNPKNSKVGFTLLLAPFAYNLKYISTDRVKATSYGLEEGKHSLHQIGTTVSSTLNWKISSTVSWASRMYYFTSYKNIQTEFENTFNFLVSRRFTAKVYLYPRFDDSLDDKVQFKEMLTFGFSYVW